MPGADHFALGSGVVPDDFAHGRGLDAARLGVLDAVDGGGDGGLHLALFKGKVGVLHAAVHQLQALAVAQGLGAPDDAVLKGEVLAVPPQILPFHHAVFTTTLRACQKASLVVRRQFSSTAS